MKITMDIERMSESDLKALALTRSLDLKKLPIADLDTLARRLVCTDHPDDVFSDYYDAVAGERRKREVRTATRKAKREADGKAWA